MPAVEDPAPCAVTCYLRDGQLGGDPGLGESQQPLPRNGLAVTWYANSTTQAHPLNTMPTTSLENHILMGW